MKKARALVFLLLFAAAPAFAGGFFGSAGSGGAGGQFDSTTFLLKDEFVGASNASGVVGQLGWLIITIGSAPAVARVAGVTDHPAVDSFATNASATAGQGGSLSLSNSTSAQTFASLGSLANWDSSWVFRLQQTADTRMRIGYMNDLTTGPPTSWMGLRWDTNTAEIYNDASGAAVFKYVCTTTDNAKTIETVGNAGAVRAANVVTIKTTTAHGFTVGDAVTIAGVTDASFNGQFFIVATPLATTFTYAQVGGGATSGSGTATASLTTTANSAVVADTNYHTLRMRSVVPGTVLFSLDGGVESALSTNCPTGAVTPTWQILTDASAQKLINLDYFAFQMSGLSR